MRGAFVVLAMAFMGCSGPASPPIESGPDLSLAGCSNDSQCGGSEPRCDQNTRRCVSCLALNDNCPRGQRCVSAGGDYRCSAACGSAADCPTLDGGGVQLCCGGQCVDSQSDVHHCGACGAPCPAPANATPACVSALCVVGMCNLGYVDCDHGANNGCEVKADTDVSNCGACGTLCSAGPNQGSSCVNGICVAECSPGFADCDGVALNGCEAGTIADSRNCGGCGHVCALANALSSCTAGSCSIERCLAGFGDCNQDASDGCEVDLRIDVYHCGSCPNSCVALNGMPACQGGSCGIASCDAGFADCDGLARNGCEVSLKDDIKNCGACGSACAGANSVQMCQGGVCQILGCAAGFADCDKAPGTGCEVHVADDPMNCGGCGKVCAMPAHATAGCASAQCGVGQCNFGFGDCNKSPADGCETDLQTLQNCGACGSVCVAPPNATAGCKAGVCGVGMCNNLFGDCDGNGQNGCEKSLANDSVNCSQCGAVCSPANAQGACIGGQCSILQCNPGFADCDNSAPNGCEGVLATDPKNCGKCASVCPMNAPVCIGGVCAAQPASCQVVNGIRWCYNPNACGENCTQVCQALGLPLTIDDNTWFNAQNTLQRCQDINNAFGLLGLQAGIQGSVYGCVEDNAGGGKIHAVPGPPVGTVNCTNVSQCPSRLRVSQDNPNVPCNNPNAIRAICPCQ